MCPEAAVGGPLAYVLDGDIITIDIPARTLTLEVEEDVLSKRQPATIPERSLSGILARYEDLADSAANGASMNHVKVCRI